MSTSYAVIVPVKTLRHAKTRLGVPEHRRGDLARAFARDVLDAATGCPGVGAVYLVGDDVDLPGASPVRRLPDEGSGDLNAALRAAERRVRAERPDLALAVLLADLPCLLAAELATALDEVSANDRSTTGERAFVADAEGTGTTLLVSRGAPLDPHFGPGSAAAHRRSGAVEAGSGLRTLRRDVDTVDDLHSATELGLAGHTRRLVESLLV